MKTKLAVLLFLLIFVFLSAVPVFANSAEPPCFVIWVNNAPEDLKITFTLGEKYDESALFRQKQGWESYYLCGYYELPDIVREEPSIIYNGDIIIESEEEGMLFRLPVPDGFAKKYNNIFYLNLKSQTLTEANTTGRTILLVVMRVLLTFLIEGLILLLFRLREKRTWFVFLIINLLTQSFLNMFISDVIPHSGYVIVVFILLEMIIIPVEMLVYVCFMREKKWYQRLLIALAANLASLMLGGWLILNLPI